MLWGLAYDGEKGASKILELMRREIDLAFALTGKFRNNCYIKKTKVMLTFYKIQ